MFSAGEQLVFTDGQNYLNLNSLKKNYTLDSQTRWAGIVLTAGQFAWCLTFINVTPEEFDAVGITLAIVICVVLHIGWF